MRKRLFQRLLYPASLLVLSGFLGSCSDLFSQQPHHSRPHLAAKPAKTQYPAEAYLQHLALARLTPEPASADVEIIEAYAAQKPGKPKRVCVVVLEYQPSHAPMRQLAAPVPCSANAKNYLSLQSVMDALNNDSMTLHNLHLASVSVQPDESLKIPDEEETRAALDDQQQHLMESAQPLPKLDDARLQLALIRFFIDHRFRDAAYLSVADVKLLLADASRSHKDAETVKVLSKELEALESELHRKLPFTLS